MTTPITRPSDYAEMLEDTPHGNKRFKEYMVDSIGDVKSRLTALENDRPMVMSSVNEFAEVQNHFKWAKQAVVGIAALGGCVYAVWEGWIHFIAWIRS